MIRFYIIFIFGSILMGSSAHTMDFKELKKEAFDAKVVGKTWINASVEAYLKIKSDGSVTVDSPMGKFVGKWEFINGKGFCREGDFAGKKLPYECQKVKLVGKRILVIYTKRFPNGNPFILLKSSETQPNKIKETKTQNNNSPIDKAKLTCTDLGFTAKTEKHADCVMKLIDK